MASNGLEQCDEVNEALARLIAGETVPVHTSDLHLQRDEAMQFVPRTKDTIGYIVMTVIFNEQGQVLMVQEAKPKCRGKWYLPAGRLEPDENIVDGAKREVMEEAGLHCEMTTLLALHFPSARWMRFTFGGRVTGGQLKTLDEQDEESLQAAFYDVDTVLNCKIDLRKKDIFPVIQQAGDYSKSLATAPLHRQLLPVIAGHSLMLHRFIVVADLGEESRLHMLMGKKGRPHILTSAIAPSDPYLHSTLYAVLGEAGGREGSSPLLRPNVHGVLGVEHCGTGQSMDGVCITTLTSVSVSADGKLPPVQDDLFAWVPITDDQCVTILRQGIDGRIVKLTS